MPRIVTLSPPPHITQVREGIEAVLYPGQEPGSRQQYLDEFGCAAWTPEALASVRRWAGGAGVVEVGAGAGKWAAALRAAGVDVRAFDDESELPDPGPEARAAGAAAEVELGDERVLARRDLYRRALLLVFPPRGPMAGNCLAAYQGDTLIYVGEGRGGVNGDAAFFDALEGTATAAPATVNAAAPAPSGGLAGREGGAGAGRGRAGGAGQWVLRHSEDLAPFPGGFERLYVFKRRMMPMAVHMPWSGWFSGEGS